MTLREEAPNAAWIAKHLGRPQLALFTQEDLAVLEPHLRSTSLRADGTLFEAGSIPRGVWIVKRGQVALSVKGAVVAVSGPGTCIGDAQVLVSGDASYTARVLEDSEFLYIDAEGFLDLIERVPVVAQRWAPKVAVQLVRAHLRISELLGRTLTERVARALLNESIDNAFPYSQEMLAAMLGSHRSPVNQVLKELERRELVRLRYRRIEVLDAKRLGSLRGD